MISGSIIGGAVLWEALAFWMTARKYTKIVNRYAVRPEDLSPEAREKAYSALRTAQILDPFP